MAGKAGDKRAAIRPLALVGAVVAAVVMLFPAHGQAARATTIIVNTTADELNGDGDCSLREAIQAANTDSAVDACPAGSGADTIRLRAGTFVLSIAGAGEDANASGDLDITADLSIRGAGAAKTAIDGGGLDRVLHIVAGTVEISGLTIRNGSSPALGGGISNSGTLTLSSSAVSGNATAADGGGIFSEGPLTLTSSTVSDNAAALGSGGILHFGAATLTLSSVSNNAAGAAGAGGIGNVPGATLTLNYSTISDNWATGCCGGIGNAGTLAVKSSTVKDNAAATGAGGIGNGGTANVTDSTVSSNTASESAGIANGPAASLTLTNSTVSDNAAVGGDTPFAGCCGGLGNAGTANVTSSTVRDNTANESGGIGNGGTIRLVNSTVTGNSATGLCCGGVGNAGTADVANSTVSGNTSGTFSGGLGNGGTLTVTNSTVSGNASGTFSGGVGNGGTLTLTNSTVSGNSAASGGGIGPGIFGFGTTTLKNTIVANNSSDDCGGGITSAGHNLDGDGTCGLGAAGDLPNTDPKLGSLAHNGGSTRTHALLPGSPAIDAGSPDCPPPASDQRGVTRPQGAACDIGSFERHRHLRIRR